MKHNIRRFEARDVEALIALCQRHSEYEQAEYSAEGKAERLVNAICVAAPRLHCYLIEVDHQAVGFFSYTFDYSTWDAAEFLYLDCLYLDEAYRGHGIGTEVFVLLKQIAHENSCVNMQWQTPVFNEAAIRFYRRIGGVDKAKQRFVLSC